MIDNFYQRYVWFISLLLLFFVIFGLLYKLKQYTIKQKVATIDSTMDTATGTGYICETATIQGMQNYNIRTDDAVMAAISGCKAHGKDGFCLDSHT
jgi:hypothetical protein